MTTELPWNVGEERTTGTAVLLAALAVFLVVYPSLLFLTGIHVVTLVSGLVPAAGVAGFLAGLVVRRGYSVRRLWSFAVAFVSIAALAVGSYRLLVEPYFFGNVSEIHFVFGRFGLGVRIAILGVVSAFASVLAR